MHSIEAVKQYQEGEWKARAGCSKEAIYKMLPEEKTSMCIIFVQISASYPAA